MIPWYKKLNPLWWVQNDDDGNCGNEWFFCTVCKKRCDGRCKIKWFLRNPMHNFTFYVIGFSDRPRIGVVRPHRVFSNQTGWYWNFVVVPYPWFKLYLPYVSYINYSTFFQFYFGWRPSGCFGIKFRWWKK